MNSSLRCSLISIRLDDIDLERADPQGIVAAGNRRFLVNDISGLSQAAAGLLAILRPVIVVRTDGAWIPVGNFRTLAIARSILKPGSVIEVVNVESGIPTNEQLSAWDGLVAPLLDALNPDTLLTELAETSKGLPAGAVKELWPAASTDSGLAGLLGVSRMTLHRARDTKNRAEQPGAHAIQNVTKDEEVLLGEEVHQTKSGG